MKWCSLKVGSTLRFYVEIKVTVNCILQYAILVNSNYCYVIWIIVTSHKRANSCCMYNIPSCLRVVWVRWLWILMLPIARLVVNGDRQYYVTCKRASYMYSFAPICKCSYITNPDLRPCLTSQTPALLVRVIWVRTLLLCTGSLMFEFYLFLILIVFSVFENSFIGRVWFVLSNTWRVFSMQFALSVLNWMFSWRRMPWITISTNLVFSRRKPSTSSITTDLKS